MKQVHYTVGMLVDHPNRPAWGPGKIVHIDATKVHVFFRDALESKARPINFTVAPLTVAASQSDSVLDLLPAPSRDGDSWRLPHKYDQSGQPAPAKPKTRARQK